MHEVRATATARVVRAGQGELIGDAPDRRVEILSDTDSLHVTWSRFGPGRDGADLHVHREHTDCFYVLDGELTVRLGPDGHEVTVPAGTLARVPPLVVHGFRNAAGAEVRYLNLHTPGRRFADYLRAMRDGHDFSYDQHDPPADGGRSPADAVVGGEVAAGPDAVVLTDVDALTVVRVSREPGREPEPEHVHDDHVESLYVLEGELALTAGGAELLAAEGDFVQVPAGLPHGGPAAAGADRVVFVEVRTPAV
jgi:quercetin dioxygenase-like cupin family protein